MIRFSAYTILLLLVACGDIHCEDPWPDDGYISIKDLFEEIQELKVYDKLPESEKEQLEADKCRMRPYFKKNIQFAREYQIELKLFLVERNWSGEWKGADVVSFLSNRRTKRAWLRTVGEETDSGWIIKSRVEISASAASPVRACLSEIKLPNELPAYGADGTEEKANILVAVVDPGKRGNTVYLRPAISKSGYEELGRSGVSEWILAQKDNWSKLRNYDPVLVEGLGILAGSRQVWRESVRFLGKESAIRSATYLPAIQDIAPLMNDNSKDYARQVEPNDLPSQEYLQERVNSGDSCSHACPRETIYAPRAAPGFAGISWKWVGIPNASLTDTGGRTSSCGCVEMQKPFQPFELELSNETLKVGTATTDVISNRFETNEPLVFVGRGGLFTETLVGSNIFIWANEAVSDFDSKIFDWITPRISGLSILQRGERREDCFALRRPGAIFLPSRCEKFDRFVPKGLCGDIVVHEVMHEIVGNIVGLAKAERFHEVNKTTLQEFLADYLTLRVGRRDSDPLYSSIIGRNCQNDHNDLGTTGYGGSYGQNQLIRTFLGQEDPSYILDRLALVTVMYEEDSPAEFIDAFFDLAADKVAVSDKALGPLCKSIENELKTCPKFCESKKFCVFAIQPDKNRSEMDPRGTISTSSKSLDIIDWSFIGGAADHDRSFVALENSGQLVDQDFRPIRGQSELERMEPGFSMSSDGDLEGWLEGGVPVVVRTDPETGRLRLIPSLQAIRGSSREKLRMTLPAVIQGGHRLELADLSRDGAVLVDWSGEIPQILRPEWTHPIDESRTQVGWDSDGKPVITVYDRLTGARIDYELSGSTLKKRKARPMAIYPIELPGVKVTSRDGKSTAIVPARGSLCKASPFLDITEEFLLMLTCDGHLSGVDLSVWPPQVRWGEDLVGVVAPGRNVIPIKRGRFVHGEPEQWTVGPIRNAERGGATSDEFFLISKQKGKVGKSISSAEMTIGSPIVITRSRQEGDLLGITTKSKGFVPRSFLDEPPKP